MSRYPETADFKADPLNVPIATIPKNSREELRVSLAEFKGTQFVDLRIYSEFAGSTHARSPTKIGVTCSFERLPQLVRALMDAEAQAQALGLIGGDE